MAVAKNECFGLLGPNGAGKSTSINMMIGFLVPTDGTAYICGKDIRSNMEEVYKKMGCCPQHDLLWEQLTGREHITFYARLKGLKGAALTEEVDSKLKKVNLFKDGDRACGGYSGGMKRRLSVAISLV